MLLTINIVYCYGPENRGIIYFFIFIMIILSFYYDSGSPIGENKYSYCFNIFGITFKMNKVRFESYFLGLILLFMNWVLSVYFPIYKNEDIISTSYLILVFLYVPLF